MNQMLTQLVKEQLGWNLADVTVEYQGDGLTNQNFIVSNGVEKYVVRISSKHSNELGINREAELAAMRSVDAIGVGANLVYFSVETGDMITRYIHGNKWSNQDVAQADTIPKIAETFLKIHALPSISHCFDPYKDIYNRIHIAKEKNLELPSDMDCFLEKLELIRGERAKVKDLYTGLCHNDPFPNNFLYDGNIRVLDWEYAGMGDIFFDLACLCYFYNEDNKELFLQSYFMPYQPSHLEGLNQMIFVVRLWNALWAVLQTAAVESNYDYSSLAKKIFSNLL